MTCDKTFEEIEIAVPESVYDNLEPEVDVTSNTDERLSFGRKLRSFFLTELGGGCT